MFFKQIRRSAAQNRKGNGLYFASLVIAIVAFYSLLSLESLDVMRFLKTVESDAVGKLLMLLPIVYGISLFFVFFMVYFACRYQVSRRRKEFGIYLMMGMRRSRLLGMLFGETLLNSVFSLAVGIPISLFLTEGISLVTARFAGLGIIGHTFAFSWKAILWTIAGFILVQFLSMAILSLKIVRTETGSLLMADSAEKQMVHPKKENLILFFAGCILLLLGYYFALFRLRSLFFGTALITVILWISGTFLLYRGLGGFLGQTIRTRGKSKTGLWTFTARQVQENVLSQHKSLALASLLLLGAMACVTFGITVRSANASDTRSVDFSIYGTEREINKVLSEKDISEMAQTAYPLYLSNVKEQYEEGQPDEIDTSDLKKALLSIPDTSGLGKNMAERSIRYVVSVDSYNQILSTNGKRKISLSDGEVAVFTSLSEEGDYSRLLDQALHKKVTIGIDGKDYSVRPELYTDNVVADRSITLSAALIVPDELYKQLADSSDPYCANVQLNPSVIKQIGLMQAEQRMSKYLSKTGIEYESYLAGIGRSLFYKVASSYLTIYLGIIFWLIANAMIGLKYLISQRESAHRYEILSMIGADSESKTESVKKQISIYFLLAVVPALISSIIAIRAMLTDILQLPFGTSAASVSGRCVIALAVFIVFEFLYIEVVKQNAGRDIRRTSR